MPAHNNVQREQRLVEEVLAVSLEANPTYTHTEHLAWALGILATTVLRKNYMDNIVYSELNERLNVALGKNQYTTRQFP